MSQYEDEAISPEDANRSVAQSMGSEPDYSSNAYDDLMKDAERDLAIGKHDWQVIKVTHEQWPSGDPYVKILGTLIDVPGQNKPKADLTWSPPPSPEEVKRESGSWEQNKKKAISQAITIARKCLEYYQKLPDKIEEGEIMRVETRRTARRPDGSGGFLRIVALHSKDQIGAAGQAQSQIPF